MTRQLEAVFQGGVLRPLQPLNLAEDQKVLVTLATIPASGEQDDYDDYIDTELHRYCEARADYSVTVEQVRQELAAIPGAMADEIIADREDRF